MIKVRYYGYPDESQDLFRTIDDVRPEVLAELSEREIKIKVIITCGGTGFKTFYQPWPRMRPWSGRIGETSPSGLSFGNR
jgi:hypothetical protein